MPDGQPSGDGLLSKFQSLWSPRKTAGFTLPSRSQLLNCHSRGRLGIGGRFIAAAVLAPSNGKGATNPPAATGPWEPDALPHSGEAGKGLGGWSGKGGPSPGAAAVPAAPGGGAGGGGGAAAEGGGHGGGPAGTGRPRPLLHSQVAVAGGGGDVSPRASHRRAENSDASGSKVSLSLGGGHPCPP